ncbi:hypothetical protein [Lentzea xinjiangensis]|uniref:hypothetical protein n=1 Tax=Lentzea xinjiangensis TaxID=402600 RepID=UPI0011606F4E|nr:hypothetical protein [Lentzea xinjiangensis]
MVRKLSLTSLRQEGVAELDATTSIGSGAVPARLEIAALRCRHADGLAASGEALRTVGPVGGPVVRLRRSGERSRCGIHAHNLI